MYEIILICQMFIVSWGHEMRRYMAYNMTLAVAGTAPGAGSILPRIHGCGGWGLEMGVPLRPLWHSAFVP